MDTTDTTDLRVREGRRMRLRMTKERKEIFLERLARRGIVGHAALHATPGSTSRIARVAFYRERDKDPEFAEAWDQAMLEAEDTILGVMWHRGVEGWEEDVYGSLGKDEGGRTGPVGTKRVYDSHQLDNALRVMSLRYRQAMVRESRVEQKTLTVKIGAELEDLSLETLEEMAALMERDRGEKAKAVEQISQGTTEAE